MYSSGYVSKSRDAAVLIFRSIFRKRRRDVYLSIFFIFDLYFGRFDNTVLRRKRIVSTMTFKRDDRKGDSANLSQVGRNISNIFNTFSLAIFLVTRTLIHRRSVIRAHEPSCGKRNKAALRSNLRSTSLAHCEPTQANGFYLRGQCAKSPFDGWPLVDVTEM